MAQILSTGAVNIYKQQTASGAGTSSSVPSSKITTAYGHTPYNQFSSKNNFQVGGSGSLKADGPYWNEGLEYEYYLYSGTRKFRTVRLQFPNISTSSSQIQSAYLVFQPKGADSYTKYAIAVPGDGDSSTAYRNYNNTAFTTKQVFAINDTNEQRIDITDSFKAMLDAYSGQTNTYCWLMTTTECGSDYFLPYTDDFKLDSVVIEYDLRVTKPEIDNVTGVPSSITKEQLNDNGITVSISAKNGLENNIAQYKVEILKSDIVVSTEIKNSTNTNESINIKYNGDNGNDYSIRISVKGSTAETAYQWSDTFISNFSVQAFPILKSNIEIENGTKYKKFDDINTIRILKDKIVSTGTNQTTINLSVYSEDSGVSSSTATRTGANIISEVILLTSTKGDMEKTTRFEIIVDDPKISSNCWSFSPQKNRIIFSGTIENYSGGTLQHYIKIDEQETLISDSTYYAKAKGVVNKYKCVAKIFDTDIYGADPIYILTSSEQTLGTFSNDINLTIDGQNILNNNDYYCDNLQIYNYYYSQNANYGDDFEFTAQEKKDDADAVSCTVINDKIIGNNVYDAITVRVQCRWKGDTSTESIKSADFTLNKIPTLSTINGTNILQLQQISGKKIVDTIDGTIPYNVIYKCNDYVRQIFTKVKSKITFKMYLGTTNNKFITFNSATIQGNEISLGNPTFGLYDIVNNFSSEQYDIGSTTAKAYLKIEFLNSTTNKFDFLTDTISINADLSVDENPQYNFTGIKNETEINNLPMQEGDNYKFSFQVNGPKRPYNYKINLGYQCEDGFELIKSYNIVTSAKADNYSFVNNDYLPIIKKYNSKIAIYKDEILIKCYNGNNGNPDITLYAFNTPQINFFAEINDAGQMEITELEIVTNNEGISNINNYQCNLKIEDSTQQLNLLNVEGAEKSYDQSTGIIKIEGAVITSSPSSFSFSNNQNAYVEFTSTRTNHNYDTASVTNQYIIQSERSKLIIVIPLIHYESGRLAINDYTFGENNTDTLLLVKKSGSYKKIVLEDGIEINFNLGGW